MGGAVLGHPWGRGGWPGAHGAAGGRQHRPVVVVAFPLAFRQPSGRHGCSNCRYLGGMQPRNPFGCAGLPPVAASGPKDTSRAAMLALPAAVPTAAHGSHHWAFLRPRPVPWWICYTDSRQWHPAKIGKASNNNLRRTAKAKMGHSYSGCLKVKKRQACNTPYFVI